MTRIYVAGPYTKGDVAVNVAAAMDAANQLIERGFAPYVPHLSHFLHMAHPQPYEKWMDISWEWLNQSDAVLVLPGESAGVKREEAWALDNIPVFYSLRELWEAMR